MILKKKTAVFLSNFNKLSSGVFGSKCQRRPSTVQTLTGKQKILWPWRKEVRNPILSSTGRCFRKGTSLHTEIFWSYFLSTLKCRDIPASHLYRTLSCFKKIQNIVPPPSIWSPIIVQLIAFRFAFKHDIKITWFVCQMAV